MSRKVLIVEFATAIVRIVEGNRKIERLCSWTEVVEMIKHDSNNF